MKLSDLKVGERVRISSKYVPDTLHHFYGDGLDGAGKIIVVAEITNSGMGIVIFDDGSGWIQYAAKCQIENGLVEKIEED